MSIDNDHDLLISLNAKVDNILDRLSSIDAIEKRVRDIEVFNSTVTEQMKTQKDEINKLRTVNSAWSTLNTVGGLILAALMGWISR